MSDIIDFEKPILEVIDDMKNQQYTILVMPFTLGQFRIQITDKDMPDSDAPDGHASIVREMCTYKRDTMMKTIVDLTLSDDPLAVAEGYVKPWNCESEGGRIRLDNAEVINAK